MATTTAISSQTAKVNSSMISLAAGETIQVYTDKQLQAGEYVRAERTYDGGTNYVPAKTVGDKGRLLSHLNMNESLTGPGDFRIVKDKTGSATTVYYDS